MSQRSLRKFLIGGGAAACLLLPSAAFADSTNAPTTGTLPSNPVALTGSFSGSLAANSGGSYRYAQFNYPGDSSTVTLNLTVDNALPLETGAAGFNIYQAGNMIGSSTEISPNTASYTLSSSTAGPVLIQVFDFNGSTGENFTLTPQGLPSMTPAATPASTATTSAAATANAKPSQNPQLGGAATGSLAGNSGGSFALYTLAFPGNTGNTTLSLDVSPTLDVANAAVGFNVYDANGNLAGSGQQTDVGTISLNISNLAAGSYTVQVFNYDPSSTVSYTLSQVNS